MNPLVRIPLQPTPEQAEKLAALQRAFAAACNALAPMVQSTRNWNRVALHHRAYKELRERFPALGSQMVCNAIYSVSRSARQAFQSPASPFRLQRMGDKPLPMLRFLDDAPVFFDRHTLSIKGGLLSMLTLDGRMRFQSGLTPEIEGRFRTEKLREIVLVSRGGVYELLFRFEDADAEAQTTSVDSDRPEYQLLLHPDEQGTAPPDPRAVAQVKLQTASPDTSRTS